MHRKVWNTNRRGRLPQDLPLQKEISWKTAELRWKKASACVPVMQVLHAVRHECECAMDYGKVPYGDENSCCESTRKAFDVRVPLIAIRKNVRNSQKVADRQLGGLSGVVITRVVATSGRPSSVFQNVRCPLSERSLFVSLARADCWTVCGCNGDTWLILPVVICLSQRLSHACLCTHFGKVKPRMAH